jgi:hypothetical protein
MDMASMHDDAARPIKIEYYVFTLNLTKEGITHMTSGWHNVN